MCVCLCICWMEGVEGARPGVTENYLCLGKSGLVLGLVIGFYKFNCFLSPVSPFPHPQDTQSHTGGFEILLGWSSTQPR